MDRITVFVLDLEIYDFRLTGSDETNLAGRVFTDIMIDAKYVILE
jgi:hypothetical protein